MTLRNKQPKRQMGTLKDKISIPENFDNAFADEIIALFHGDKERPPHTLSTKKELHHEFRTRLPTRR
ncbi:MULTISPECIES: hypothetical protein [unclassified Moraxella]|uniref:hypothetical protein n=1 Tax=unclassified Moraxella TaxID=2685852 RepID=UPI003AF7FB8D